MKRKSRSKNRNDFTKLAKHIHEIHIFAFVVIHFSSSPNVFFPRPAHPPLPLSDGIQVGIDGLLGWEVLSAVWAPDAHLHAAVPVRSIVAVGGKLWVHWRRRIGTVRRARTAAGGRPRRIAGGRHGTLIGRRRTRRTTIAVAVAIVLTLLRLATEIARGEGSDKVADARSLSLGHLLDGGLAASPDEEADDEEEDDDGERDDEGEVGHDPLDDAPDEVRVRAHAARARPRIAALGAVQEEARRELARRIRIRLARQLAHAKEKSER